MYLSVQQMERDKTRKVPTRSVLSNTSEVNKATTYAARYPGLFHPYRQGTSGNDGEIRFFNLSDAVPHHTVRDGCGNHTVPAW